MDDIINGLDKAISAQADPQKRIALEWFRGLRTGEIPKDMTLEQFTASYGSSR